ncbi:MAG: hypothetical protein OXC98_14040 [bacterium]|nr:PD-(D/E)XK nuclease family protein [Acidimicrobiia bacterium]MCY4651455.1 hypothetical protein [bacterium]
MTQEPTLLAHLVPRLTSQVEDAATEALAFILNRSKACRSALDSFLRTDEFEIEPITRFETQVTHEDGSRPDMVGYDRSGSKRLLVESKFWAALQPDQAIRYLRMLDGPGVLLFIAPESRIETLWWEIRRQMECEENKTDCGDCVRLECLESPQGTRRARIDDLDQHLMLASWTGLLDILDCADVETAADIRQLRGLAKRQDEGAFLPIHPNELGPVLPRRVPGLYRLVDDVVTRGVGEKWMSTDGLAIGLTKEYYGRYLTFTDKAGCLFLCVNFDFWATSGDTPLWLWIRDDVRISLEYLPRKVPSSATNWSYAMPIYLKTGVEYDRVLEDATRHKTNRRFGREDLISLPLLPYG